MFIWYVGGGVGHRSNPSMETYEDEVDQNDDIDIERNSSVHTQNPNVACDDQQDDDSDDENQEEWGIENQPGSDDDSDLGPEDGENNSDSDDEYDDL
jgi:hypothetical protein